MLCGWQGTPAACSPWCYSRTTVLEQQSSPGIVITISLTLMSLCHTAVGSQGQKHLQIQMPEPEVYIYCFYSGCEGRRKQHCLHSYSLPQITLKLSYISKTEPNLNHSSLVHTYVFMEWCITFFWFLNLAFESNLDFIFTRKSQWMFSQKTVYRVSFTSKCS